MPIMNFKHTPHYKIKFYIQREPGRVKRMKTLSPKRTVSTVNTDKQQQLLYKDCF